jgi:hypothetical protein
MKIDVPPFGFMSCMPVSHTKCDPLSGAEARESILKPRYSVATTDASEYSCKETPCATPRNESPTGSTGSPPTAYCMDVYM